MVPIKVTVGPLANAVANSVSASQTAAGPGNLLINGTLAAGGIATLDAARNVLITSVGNDSGITFGLTGTNWAGDAVSETVTGPNATTATSLLDYKTITQVSVSNATANAVTVGTTGTADSPWIRLDPWAGSSSAIQCVLSGSANYSVQQSLDDPNSATSVVAVGSMTWSPIADSAATNASTSIATSLTATPVWVRARLLSGAGAVAMTVAQSGVVNR